MSRQPPRSPLFPYTTLSRSQRVGPPHADAVDVDADAHPLAGHVALPVGARADDQRGGVPGLLLHGDDAAAQDRKSTRLNSSHANISYAVFCLKKKNKLTLHM